MKKFILVAFFLLFGFTTTTSLANDDAAPVDSAVAANGEMTLYWDIFGGPAVIDLRGISLCVDGVGSFQLNGVAVDDIAVFAGNGYILQYASVSVEGDNIIIRASVYRPSLP